MIRRWQLCWNYQEEYTNAVSHTGAAETAEVFKVRKWKSGRKVIISSAIALMMLVGAVCGQARADIGAEGNVTWVSSYIWRGFDLLADDEPAIQPGLAFSLPHDMSLGLWGSYGLDDEDDLDEFDVTLSKSGTFKCGTEWSIGHTYYTFPVVDQESQETFVGLVFPSLMLSPALDVYFDWGDGDGVYAALSGGLDVPFSGDGQVPLSLGVSIGYSDGYWGIEPGVTDVSLSAAVPVPVKAVTITPALNYVVTPGDRANNEDEFWGGIDIAFSF